MMIAVAAVILFCSTGALRAQNANPFSAYFKGQWTNIRDLLVKMADRMPEEGHRAGIAGDAAVAHHHRRGAVLNRVGQLSCAIVPMHLPAEPVARVGIRGLRRTDRAAVGLLPQRRSLHHRQRLSMPPTKAEVMAAMKTTNDECDSVFNSLTDADLGKMINLGRGAPRPELAVLEGLVLEHSQEVYGYTAVYLRLKGLVPPSSDRNER
jgi:hypothetical protein